MIYALAIFFLYIPIFLFFPTKVIHKKRLPKGKMIVTSNHYSNLDPLVLIVRFNRHFRFLGKKELFKTKFLSFIMNGLGVISVDRDSMSPSTYKEIMANLKMDKQIFIFPEGTRNKAEDDNLQDVKNGIITFASKGESEIIPMIIHRKPKMFRKNYIIVGESIKIEGENPKRLTKEEQEANLNRYVEAMNNLREELDEYLGNKKRKNKK